MRRTGKGLFTGIGIHGHCEAGSVAVIQNRVQMYAGKSGGEAVKNLVSMDEKSLLI